jgi:hypothetical protein
MANSFVCNKDIFRHIYQLEKRRSGRKKYPSYLSHIKISRQQNNNLKKAINGMEDILSKRLRSGDVVCRWSYNHFVLILNNIEDYDVNKVMNRIKNHFLEDDKDDNKIDVNINYMPIG